MIKYVLCPGNVVSKNDGQVHFISAEQLASLYRVPMRECTVWDNLLPYVTNTRNHAGLIALSPRRSGNYDDLPTSPLRYPW